MFDQINLLIMPTDQCNMRCKYCFHGDEGYNVGIMNITIFKKIIDVIAPSCTRIQIVWHGGEPLLAPLSFYEEAYHYCRTKENNFVFSIQTNATLLNKDNIDFFKKNSTRFGISYDGLTHEEVRGNGQTVISNISLLKQMGIIPGAILVVTKKNVSQLIAEYEYFKKMNLALKLNPMFVDGAAKHHSEYALDVSEYCHSFIVFFKYWIFDTACNINVQTCYDFVKLILGYRASVCSYNSCVGKWFCINHLGFVYPCDRLYSNEFCLGNIEEYTDFEEIYENERFKEMIKSAIERREYCKKTCNIFDKCNGGCNASAHLGKGISVAENDFCYIQKNIISKLTPVVMDALNASKGSINPKFISLVDSLSK